MSFGNVAVGSHSVQKGTLTAGAADITVSSAAWNGQGYSVSGITFPVTVPAAQSVPFTVTFAPQSAGSAPGSIVFDSNATNSPATETLTGGGTQASQHTVALSWNPSTSQVVGYNVYRGSASGGPYARLTTAADANTAYTDTSVQSGQTYYYVTTSVDSSNVESAYSNQATAAIP
jgi:fibronectin type 3 domain-containing protein